MSKIGIEGAAQKTVGAAKEGLGKLLHNDKLIAEGVADRVAGVTKETAGRGVDAVHKASK